MVDARVRLWVQQVEVLQALLPLASASGNVPKTAGGVRQPVRVLRSGVPGLGTADGLLGG